MFGPDVDLADVAQKYERDGYAIVANALDVVRARSLADSLPVLSWSLAHHAHGESKKLNPFEYSSASPELLRSLEDVATADAVNGFQFMYESYMMVTAYLEDPNMPAPLKAWVELVNAPSTLSQLAAITGASNVRKVDAQATCYRPGHFLTRHDDRHEEHGRIAAYVLNLSQEWNPVWGGLLHFTNSDGEVLETVVPAFNQLTLFSVPQEHFVSHVAPFAGANRYSITGWVRSE